MSDVVMIIMMIAFGFIVAEIAKSKSGIHNTDNSIKYRFSYTGH